MPNLATHTEPVFRGHKRRDCKHHPLMGEHHCTACDTMTHGGMEDKCHNCGGCVKNAPYYPPPEC